MSTTDELAWFKSSYSDNEGANCLEVAMRPEAVHIRDSKDTHIQPLTITPSTWAAFTSLAARN
ncbi:DUF397 domain-containing protein [Streptomyces sp. LaPpAH-108]|uniref:DUF397 domain-containing protein n=1 Tax=Streptomyces sp. LaPpAH-108 TaxID=1155714 RepID=UPI000377D355|nr:DUF397 domain-containing protein [Streptomyces sp. LaPpAH-108]